jgi:transposase
MANFDQVQILSIKISISLIASINQKIKEVDAEIQSRIVNRQRDLEIAMSIPGIDFVSGVTILAEIGNYRDFTSPEQIAAYFGLVPYVYQSAGKLYTGPITKMGSKHLRWILVQVAHAASRVKNSMFRRFFLRVRGRRGYNVAIVALARKILCILYHLLINQEMYLEETKKPRHSKHRIPETSEMTGMSLEKMIDLIRQSGYVISRTDGSACG